MLIHVVWLTAASFALLVAVDEEVAGALRAEGQQDTLQHSWQQSETQQEGPQGGIAHDGFYSKDLQRTKQHNTMILSLSDASQWLLKREFWGPNYIKLYKQIMNSTGYKNKSNIEK